MEPIATVAIATRNRREDLRRALQSALAQEGALELLVLDDGSSDGTSEMVREEFPEVRLERRETGGGLIARRNELARLASAPVMVSIDDDAEFTAPDIVTRAARALEHPRVGAVAIPYVERGRGDTEVRQLAPDDHGVWVTGPYIGTAHALKREAFLGLGGYRTSLVRNTEELDLWTRMLEAGLVTRLGSGAPIHHHESDSRVVSEIVYFDCRNNVLHAWRNVPLPYVVVRLAKVVLYASAVVAPRTGQPVAVARGLAAGAAAALRAIDERQPVRRETYRLAHEIRTRGTVPLAAIEGRLG
jgi:glycosyltransferase involved in cell wall biosynthesis